MLRLRFRTKVLLPFLFGFRDDVTGTFLLLDGPGASPCEGGAPVLRLRFRPKVLLPFLLGFRDDVTGTFLLLNGPGASPSISVSV